MTKAHELLKGKHLGILSAHPDDALFHGNLIETAKNSGAIVEELILTRGRAGKNLRTNDPSFVRGGRRSEEATVSGLHLGMQGVQHLDGTDGALATQKHDFVSLVSDWAFKQKLEIIVSPGNLQDHFDHKAATEIAKLAVEHLAANHDYSLSSLQLDMTGEKEPDRYRIDPTPRSIRTTFEAAQLNASQFKIADAGDHPDWTIVEGLAVHGDTLRELDQYPIRQPAFYLFIAANIPDMDQNASYAIL